MVALSDLDKSLACKKYTHTREYTLVTKAALTQEHTHTERETQDVK